MAAGKILRIETLARATVVWGLDGWQQVKEIDTVDTELGVYVADLETTAFASGAVVEFTFFWLDEARWEQTDFRVVVT